MEFVPLLVRARRGILTEAFFFLLISPSCYLYFHSHCAEGGRRRQAGGQTAGRQTQEQGRAEAETDKRQGKHFKDTADAHFEKTITAKTRTFDETLQTWSRPMRECFFRHFLEIKVGYTSVFEGLLFGDVITRQRKRENSERVGKAWEETTIGRGQKTDGRQET